jgi:hypothetical protein
MKVYKQSGQRRGTENGFEVIGPREPEKSDNRYENSYPEV